MTPATVLLVGGTGRTGGRVLRQLLERGVRVRAIVRSSAKLPPKLIADPNLSVIEADLLSLSDRELQQHLLGCDAVISCLGHNLSLKGILGPPRDLVAQAATRLCRGVQALRPDHPARFILMSSVSVNRQGRLDARRGRFEKAALAVLRTLIPPARDNQRAADFLIREIGEDDPHVQWTAVRPDTLLEGEACEYSLHEGLVSTLFKPDSTNMANIADFMCELATDPGVWNDWKGRLPVIVNAVVA